MHFYLLMFGIDILTAPANIPIVRDTIFIASWEGYQQSINKQRQNERKKQKQINKINHISLGKKKNIKKGNMLP